MERKSFLQHTREKLWFLRKRHFCFVLYGVDFMVIFFRFVLFCFPYGWAKRRRGRNVDREKTVKNVGKVRDD